MNRLIRSAAVAFALTFAAPALAQQSAGEAIDNTGNDVKRVVRKGANRVEEALCTASKAECARRKGSHRVTEAKDEVVDATKKAVDKVD